MKTENLSTTEKKFLISEIKKSEAKEKLLFIIVPIVVGALYAALLASVHKTDGILDWLSFWWGALIHGIVVLRVVITPAMMIVLPVIARFFIVEIPVIIDINRVRRNKWSAFTTVVDTVEGEWGIVEADEYVPCLTKIEDKYYIELDDYVLDYIEELGSAEIVVYFYKKKSMVFLNEVIDEPDDEQDPETTEEIPPETPEEEPVTPADTALVDEYLSDSTECEIMTRDPQPEDDSDDFPRESEDISEKTEEPT